MSQKLPLRNRPGQASSCGVAVVGGLAVLLAGGSPAAAAELTPLGIEKAPGLSGDPRGRYSDRTLTAAVQIDREGSRLVAYTVKDRPFVRPLDPPAVMILGQAHDPQIEAVLLGPGNVRHTQRKQLQGLCLLHPPDAAPHVAGDTIRLHRDTILVDIPDVAGFDRLEVAFHEGGPHAPVRRSLGVQRLDAAHFTPAGGRASYGGLAHADAGVESGGEAVAAATSGQVRWPEEFGDADIYRVEGDEAEIDRRINVTVVPDGYTYADKAVMDAHFDAMVAHFRNKTPYKEHDPFVNYILVYAYSNESGTDQCDCDIIVDTAMATRFLEPNPQCGHSDNRCLYYGGGCDTNSSGNIALAEMRAPFPPAQPADGRIVMVNTTRYGGCGGYRAVYSAAHGAGVEVAVHELGHSLGGLADEYSYNADCGTGAGERNTSLDGTMGAWPEWIAEIGAPREGAQYYQQCVYRPEDNCEMRSLNQPFCAVCRQRWSLVYFGHPNIDPTAPLESISPASPADVETFVPTEFSVVTRLATGATNEFQWTIDGPGYPGPTAVGTSTPTYEHTFTQPGSYTLSCTIIADTNFIKPERYGANVDTATWQLTVADSSIDGDGDGYSPATGDCDDGDSTTYPTAPELCDGRNNDCDDPSWPTTTAAESDDDGDGLAECAPQSDCDDADGSIFPGAPEINDGLDNQCPGEPGFGAIDETSGESGFHALGDTTLYSWTPQQGASRYQTARSTSPDFSLDCFGITTSDAEWVDPDVPPPGTVFHYLNRPFKPKAGSWGLTSTGSERVGACL